MLSGTLFCAVYRVGVYPFCELINIAQISLLGAWAVVLALQVLFEVFHVCFKKNQLFVFGVVLLSKPYWAWVLVSDMGFWLTVLLKVIKSGFKA